MSKEIKADEALQHLYNATTYLKMDLAQHSHLQKCYNVLKPIVDEHLEPKEFEVKVKKHEEPEQA